MPGAELLPLPGAAEDPLPVSVPGVKQLICVNLSSLVRSYDLYANVSTDESTNTGFIDYEDS